MAAAEAWAAGKSVANPPASLRLLTLCRLARGGATVDLLAQDYELIREWECYGAAEARARARQQQRDRRVSRRGGKGRRR